MKYLLILSFYHLFIIFLSSPSLYPLILSAIPLSLSYSSQWSIPSFCLSVTPVYLLFLFLFIFLCTRFLAAEVEELFICSFCFVFSKIHFYVKQLIFDITIIKSSPLVICCPHGSAAFFLSDFQHFLPPTIKLGQIIIVRNFLRIHQKLLLINIIIIIILLNMYLTLLTLQNILLHLRC